LDGDSGGTVKAINTFAANGLISRRTSPGSIFYTFDPSGNVAQRLDNSATVLSSDHYDAFGAHLSTATGAGASFDPTGFGGQWGGYTDAETGLVLMTHRYYDPNAGRFLTRDPIGYAGGINLYAYTQNNPVSKIDPSGFGSILFTCGAMAGGGVYGLGGGYSGSVGTGFDTSGNIGVVTQGATYGLGASGGPGGIVEQSGPGVTFSTGDLRNC